MKFCIDCIKLKSLDQFYFRKDTGEHRKTCSECIQSKRPLVKLQTELRKIAESSGFDSHPCRECFRYLHVSNFYTGHKTCKECVGEKQKEQLLKNALTVTVESKLCNLCKEIKTSTDFTKAKRNKDGLSTRCKDCRGKTRNRIAENRTSVLRRKERGEEYKRKNREYCHNRRALLRANAGLLFKGYYNYIVDFYNGICAKCGSVDDPTIDHIVPLKSGGLHCVKNMQVLCHFHNSSKQNRETIDYRETCINWSLVDLPMVNAG